MVPFADGYLEVRTIGMPSYIFLQATPVPATPQHAAWVLGGALLAIIILATAYLLSFTLRRMLGNVRNDYSRPADWRPSTASTELATSRQSQMIQPDVPNRSCLRSVAVPTSNQIR